MLVNGAFDVADACACRQLLRPQDNQGPVLPALPGALEEHREVLDWTPERLQDEAKSIGGFTGRLIERVFECSRHPLQGARTSLGILRLGQAFGLDRLERACERALVIQALTYKSIRSILKKGLDRLPLPEPPPPAPSIQHDNIRGAQYFH